MHRKRPSSASSSGGMGDAGGGAAIPKQNPHIFTKGSSVEVLTEEQDYGGVFFTATIIDQPPPSSSKKGTEKKLHVQYHNLLAEEGGSEPLVEYVDVSMVRPEPPPSRERAEGFEVGEMVDSFYNDGWWAGVVTQLVGGAEKSSRRFMVYFHRPPDVREFGASDLRPHLDWVDGAWVKPEKQVIPVHSSDNGVHFLDQALQISPYSSQSLMNNRTDKLTPKKSSQVTKRRRSPQSPVSSPPLIKHKTIAEVLSDLKSQDRTSDNPSRHKPIRRKRSKVGAKEVNEKIHSLSTASMSKNSEKLLQPQSTEVVIGGKKSPSQDVENKLARNQYELPLVICLPFADKGTSASGKSRVRKERTSSGQRRGRPQKNLFDGLQSPMAGTAKNGITNPKLVNKDNLGASGEQTKEKNCNAETEEIVTEAPYSKSTDNLSLSISMKDIQSPPTIAVKRMNHGDTEGISIGKYKYQKDGDVLQEGSGNNLEINQQCRLPFVKTYSLWKSIESTEVIKRIPQRPHFMPLEKFAEYSREGLAIGLMITFTRVVEKASNLCFSDSKSIMVEILGTLADLESHGFDVRAVRDQVNDFLAMKDKHQGYVKEVKKLKNEILSRRNEKTRICKEIDEMKRQTQKLQETLSLAESANVKADEEIAYLESKLREAEEVANSAEGCFSKRHFG